MDNSGALTGRPFGQYVLGPLLGRGGMAEVYLADQPSLNRKVAIKVMGAGMASDPTFVERFRREATLVGRLMHANILQVYDFGQQDDALYIVMAYVAGGTLSERFQSGVDWADCARIVGQVADGLGFAHSEGVVHRDLKPANIFMARPDYPLIGDFGIARLVEDRGLTLTGATIGTPRYMSPEQAIGSPLDGRSDLYALGVILYQLATGAIPFDGENSLAIIHKHVYEPVPPPVLRPGFPEALTPVILRALAKQPQDRFQSGADFRDALSAVHAGRDSGPYRTAAAAAGATTVVAAPGAIRVTPAPAPRGLPRRAIVAGGLGAGLVACIGGGGALAVGLRRRTEPESALIAASGPGATPTPAPPVRAPSTAVPPTTPPAATAPPAATQAPARGGITDDALWNLITEANRVWAVAVRTLVTSELDRVYGGKILREEVQAVNELRQKNQYRIVENLSLEKRSMDIKGDGAVAKTRESWRDRWFDRATNQVVRERNPWTFEQEYVLTNIGGRWLVTDVVFN